MWLPKKTVKHANSNLVGKNDFSVGSGSSGGHLPFPSALSWHQPRYLPGLKCTSPEATPYPPPFATAPKTGHQELEGAAGHCVPITHNVPLPIPSPKSPGKRAPAPHLQRPDGNWHLVAFVTSLLWASVYSSTKSYLPAGLWGLSDEMRSCI